MRKDAEAAHRHFSAEGSQKRMLHILAGTSPTPAENGSRKGAAEGGRVNDYKRYSRKLRGRHSHKAFVEGARNCNEII